MIAYQGESLRQAEATYDAVGTVPAVIPEAICAAGLLVFTLRPWNDTLTVYATEEGVIDGEGHG